MLRNAQYKLYSCFTQVTVVKLDLPAISNLIVVRRFGISNQSTQKACTGIFIISNLVQYSDTDSKSNESKDELVIQHTA
jgi:hypothetical protein